MASFRRAPSVASSTGSNHGTITHSTLGDDLDLLSYINSVTHEVNLTSQSRSNIPTAIKQFDRDLAHTNSVVNEFSRVLPSSPRSYATMSHRNKASRSEQRTLAQLHANVADDTTGSIISQRPQTVTFAARNTRFSKPTRTNVDGSQYSDILPTNRAPTITNSAIAAQINVRPVNITQNSDILLPRDATTGSTTAETSIGRHYDRVNSLVGNIRKATESTVTRKTIPHVEITDTFDITPAAQPANVSTKRLELDDDLTDQLRIISPPKPHVKLRTSKNQTRFTNNPTESSFIAPNNAESPQIIRPSFKPGTGVPFPREEQDIYGNIDSVKAQAATLELQLAQALQRIQRRDEELRKLKHQSKDDFQARTEKDIAATQLSKALIRIEQLEEDNASLVRNNSQLKTALENSEQQSAQLHRKIVRKSEASTQREQSSEDLKQRNAHLQARSTKLASDNERLRTERKNTKERLVALEDNLKQMFEHRHQSKTTTTTTHRRHHSADEMTSAFIIPDISINTTADVHPVLSSNARRVLDGLCKHECKDCKICSRVASFDNKTYTKSTIRVPKPVPVSERMQEPKHAGDEPTMRPSMEPGLALNKVIKSLEAEVSHLKSEHARAAAAYNKCDVSLGLRDRRALKIRIDELLSELERKSTQIYRLYDVLEGQDIMTDRDMEMTVLSIIEG